MVRPTDAYGDQLSLGPRHGAQDGAGRRALEAYHEFDGPGPTPPRHRFIDYPRAGRRGWTRWIPSWRVFVSLFLLGVALLTGTFLVLYSRTELPSQTNADALFQTTIVYASDNKTEIGRFEAQNRIWVPLNKIPPVVQHAVLSAEDRTFYTNQGISVTSVVRARAEQPARRRDPGWLDDHAAVRQERLLERQRPLLHPQAARVLRLAEGRAGAGQGPDPRALPQHHLLRPRLLRRRGRVAVLLPQGRRQAHPERGGLPRGDHQRPRAVRLRDGLLHRRREGPVDLRPRRHGHGGVAAAGAAPGQRFPKIQPKSQAASAKSGARQPAAVRHADGAGRGRADGDQRQRPAAEGLPDLHDVRQEPGQGRAEERHERAGIPQGLADRNAGGDRHDRRQDRRGRLDLRWRRQARPERGHAGHRPGRVDVQALRPRRGPRGQAFRAATARRRRPTTPA